MKDVCAEYDMSLTAIAQWLQNQLLDIPVTNKAEQTRTFSSQSFQSAATMICNSLPSNIFSSKTLDSFQKCLETHLFQSAFNNP